MARIRTIKPEFWSSEQVMECSPTARLLFIGMWNFADDNGRMPFSAKAIKAQVLPGDEINADAIRRMIDELSRVGLIDIYTVDGKVFLQITGWRHQKIDRPQKPRHPAPPPEHSPSPRRALVALSELTVGEGKGAKDAAPSARSSKSEAEADLFRRGKEILGKECGGLIARVLKSKDGNTALARAVVEQASTKHDPREWIGAVLRNGGSSPSSDYVDPRL